MSAAARGRRKQSESEKHGVLWGYGGTGLRHILIPSFMGKVSKCGLRPFLLFLLWGNNKNGERGLRGYVTLRYLLLWGRYLKVGYVILSISFTGKYSKWERGLRGYVAIKYFSPKTLNSKH